MWLAVLAAQQRYPWRRPVLMVRGTCVASVAVRWFALPQQQLREGPAAVLAFDPLAEEERPAIVATPPALAEPNIPRFATQQAELRRGQHERLRPFGVGCAAGDGHCQDCAQGPLRVIDLHLTGVLDWAESVEGLPG